MGKKSYSNRTKIGYIFILFVMLYTFSRIYELSENVISRRILKLHDKIHQMQLRYQKKSEEVAYLLQFIDPIFMKNNSYFQKLSVPTQKIRGYSKSMDFQAPTVYNFLPHMLSDTRSSQPAYMKSQGRRNVSIVMGYPVSKKDNITNIIESIGSLINNMNQDCLNDSLIVVYIEETSMTNIHPILNLIGFNFLKHIDSGLIDIISPPISYYPDMSKLRLTHGENHSQVYRRTKQNLDLSFLMAYAQTRGKYYILLESGTTANQGYMTIIKRAIQLENSRESRNNPWFILDCGDSELMGKLMKTADLPLVITFVHMFYNDRPFDWLINHITELKICNWSYERHRCIIDKKIIWIKHKSVFNQIHKAILSK